MVLFSKLRARGTRFLDNVLKLLEQVNRFSELVLYPLALRDRLLFAYLGEYARRNKLSGTKRLAQLSVFIRKLRIVRRDKKGFKDAFLAVFQAKPAHKRQAAFAFEKMWAFAEDWNKRAEPVLKELLNREARGEIDVSSGGPGGHPASAGGRRGFDKNAARLMCPMPAASQMNQSLFCGAAVANSAVAGEEIFGLWREIANVTIPLVDLGMKEDEMPMLFVNGTTERIAQPLHFDVNGAARSWRGRNGRGGGELDGEGEEFL